MTRSHHLQSFQAKALLRLANQLHFTRDPLNRKKQMIDGLCDLVQATGGSCILTHHDPATRQATLVSNTETRRVEHARAPSTEFMQSRFVIAAGPSVILERGTIVSSRIDLLDSSVSATLCLYLDGDSNRRFSQHDRVIVDLFHGEMSWIYHADVLLASPSALSLSPRARQTLEHLLAGLSEKQIALRLKLSPNTVHHYVKLIHKHFDVSTRSELLARWVGK